MHYDSNRIGLTTPQSLLGAVTAWPDCAGAPDSGRSGPHHLPKKVGVEGFSNLRRKSGAPRTWLHLRRPLSPLPLTCSPMSCLTHVVTRSTADKAAAHVTGSTLQAAGHRAIQLRDCTKHRGPCEGRSLRRNSEATTDSHPISWAPPCCDRAPLGGTPACHRPWSLQGPLYRAPRTHSQRPCILGAQAGLWTWHGLVTITCYNVCRALFASLRTLLCPSPL